jgi:hypothetical protein
MHSLDSKDFPKQVVNFEIIKVSIFLNLLQSRAGVKNALLAVVLTFRRQIELVRNPPQSVFIPLRFIIEILLEKEFLLPLVLGFRSLFIWLQVGKLTFVLIALPCCPSFLRLVIPGGGEVRILRHSICIHLLG